MKINIKQLIAIASLITLVFASCQKSNDPEPNPASSSEKNITAFVLTKADNPSLAADVYGTITSDSVKIVLPKGSVLGSYIPTITSTGKSISPESKIAQNFSNTLTYTVTAQDGSKRTYSVITRILLSSDKTITAFQFKATENPGILASDISGTITADSVLLTVPHGTNITNLNPTIIFNGKTVTPSSLVKQDYTRPLIYLVTAEDGSTKTYVVKVIVAPQSATVYMSSKWWYGSPPVTGKFYAFDANTGAVKWMHETETSSPVYSTGSFAAGVVYRVTGFDLKAIDAQTGAVKWKYAPATTSMSTTPCIANGKVYINCDNNTLHALDAETGALLWTFAQTPPEGTFNRNYCNPTVVDGVVYFGSPDEYIYALDATTGGLKWKTHNQSPYAAGNFTTNPAVSNGVLFIGDTYRNLIAYNTADGKELWRFRTGSGTASSPTVENGIAYFGSSNGTLYAMDVATGTPKWGYGAGASIHGGPVVDNGIVYISSEGAGLHAVDAATGTLKWKALTNADIKGAPVVFNGTVYVGYGMAFVALNAATGTVKWQYTAASDMNTFAYTSPFVIDVDGNAYYPSDAGNKQ